MSFSFQVDMTDISPAGGRGSSHLPEGYYSVLISSLSGPDEKGMITFHLTIKGGDLEGISKQYRMGAPSGNNLYYWRTALESAGMSEAEAGKKNVEITEECFLNKTAYIYFKPGNRDAGVYDQTKFLVPVAWKAAKLSFEMDRRTVAAAAPTSKSITTNNGQTITVKEPSADPLSGLSNLPF